MVTLTSRILRDSPRVAEAANNKRRPIGFPETGDGVERVQLALINLDFPLPRSTRKTGTPDGIFGGETLSALKAFQRSKALKDDGMAGPDTLERMDQLLGLRRGGGRIEPVPVPETRAAFMTGVRCQPPVAAGVIAISPLQRDQPCCSWRAAGRRRLQASRVPMRATLKCWRAVSWFRAM